MRFPTNISKRAAHLYLDIEQKCTHQAIDLRLQEQSAVLPPVKRQIEKITSPYKDVILVSLDYQSCIYTFFQAAGNLRHADEACWGRNSCHCPLTRYWLTFVFSFDGRDLVLSGLKMPHNSIILAPSLPDYYDKPTYLFYQHTNKKI